MDGKHRYASSSFTRKLMARVVSKPIEAHDVGSLLHIDFLDDAFAEHGMTHAAALTKSHIGAHAGNPLVVGRMRAARAASSAV